LIIPIWNILKEEVETLALPLANKRAKSPAGITILRRGEQGGKASRGGWKAVKKERIKKEVKEEVKCDGSALACCHLTSDMPTTLNVSH
jgi:hypothetical protein